MRVSETVREKEREGVRQRMRKVHFTFERAIIKCNFHFTICQRKQNKNQTQKKKYKPNQTNKLWETGSYIVILTGYKTINEKNLNDSKYSPASVCKYIKLLITVWWAFLCRCNLNKLQHTHTPIRFFGSTIISVCYQDTKKSGT